MDKYSPAKQGTQKDAKLLRLLREKRGWTQRDAAKEFYVSPGTIALWENGDRKISGPALRLIEIFNGGLDGQRRKRQGTGT